MTSPITPHKNQYPAWQLFTLPCEAREGTFGARIEMGVDKPGVLGGLKVMPSPGFRVFWRFG